MAEQAFKQQVQSVMGDGNLTPDRAAALEKMREQVLVAYSSLDRKLPLPSNGCFLRFPNRAGQDAGAGGWLETMLVGNWSHSHLWTPGSNMQICPPRRSFCTANHETRHAFPPIMQMGLPKENADKIIRGFTNQKAIASMQARRAAAAVHGIAAA